jgi:DUF971 family protein
MNHPAVLIKKIEQKSNTAFVIEWSDGEVAEYRLSALQKRCPCAQCLEQTENLDPDVRALRLMNVGRYALRIQFTSGCSKGIYSFAMLRQLAREKANV